MRTWVSMLGFVIALSSQGQLWSADLLLREGEKSDYRIVLPDEAESELLWKDLHETAKMLQGAFEANGAKISILKESEHEAGEPALYLGNTQYARAQGLDASKLVDWNYHLRVSNKSVILLGNDHLARAQGGALKRPNWNRVGSAKAAVDFAREFLGVRFLYPDLKGYVPLRELASVELKDSPAVEFLKSPQFTLPEDLNREVKPQLKLNIAHPSGGSLYDLALNRFPRVDMEFGNHTWGRAVSAGDIKNHPEYFAWVRGKRLVSRDGEKAQFCLANPEVQELIYQDVAKRFDQGFETVDLGQPDGFVPCECEDCHQLYGTGDDWSEKIWIFHRKVAERLEQSHPGKEVSIMSYILTAMPPKTFQEFPSNVSVMLTGTGESDTEPWRDVVVPRGFTGYVYNWCANLGTRYTPMRTPGFVELQVKRLSDLNVRGLMRDGPGQLFGLEGPVYYAMGRMFDDPHGLNARALMDEFLQGAFPEPQVQAHMKSFYDRLYQAIALYSDQIGTRSPYWQFRLYPSDARTVKSVSDPFQLITFLYAPQTLLQLEATLKQAEQKATHPKALQRLKLVRSEFDYLKHLARVAHLYQAWQSLPDESSMNRLLDSIDRRNEFVKGLFSKDKSWDRAFFPFPGHSLEHLKLAHDSYQEPYSKTCYNWDTSKMRGVAKLEIRSVKVQRARSKQVTLNSLDWESVASEVLSPLPPLLSDPKSSTVKLLWDDRALYVRFESELGAAPQLAGWARDSMPQGAESVSVHLRPDPQSVAQFHLAQGPRHSATYDAKRGDITDVMDPRYGTDDASWNGEWSKELEVNSKKKRWSCLLVISYETLQVETPEEGAVWNANFARSLGLPRQQADQAIWSMSGFHGDSSDPDSFGNLQFVRAQP